MVEKTHKTLGPRSLDNKRATVVGPPLLHPPETPPQQCQPGSQQNKCLPRLGERTSRRRGQHRPTTWPKTKLMNLIFVLWQIFGTNC